MMSLSQLLSTCEFPFRLKPCIVPRQYSGVTHELPSGLAVRSSRERVARPEGKRA